jgi:hypothetical protein
VNPGYIPKGDFAYAPVLMKLCGIWQALATLLDEAGLGETQGAQWRCSSWTPNQPSDGVHQ